jgi:hypothetical protein
MNLDWIPERAFGTFTRRSGDGLLIETYHDGYAVNGTGAFLWAQIGSGVSATAIAERLATQYGVDGATARQATEGFLGELLARGFITSADGADAGAGPDRPDGGAGPDRPGGGAGPDRRDADR